MGPLRVLIAELDGLTRTLLRARLEKLGHQVVAEADNGLLAVECARTSKPDAVILNVKMPELDGIEAARQIVAEHPCAILFLSAHRDDDLVHEAGEAGALAYLLKPFRKEELGPALRTAMHRFRQIRKQHAEIEELKEALETRKLIDRAKGILMDRHGMNEGEAFKRIHYQARNQNKKMREIAESIITASDLI